MPINKETSSLRKTVIYIKKVQAEAIGKIAQERKVKPSKIYREMVENYVANHKK